MLIFKKIEYKNIQSVGNHPIVIDLNRSRTTVIGGKNGTGKSTLWVALAYGLYGKLLSKDQTLPEVVNSVNKKNLLVKVSFSVNSDEWEVVRGEKPKLFEIHKNGDLVNQTAASSDYQKFLDLVLGMDFNTFVQVILLNKERFKPFMEMASGDRRKVIEQILDISVFSEMNELCKKQITMKANEASTIEHNRTIIQTKIESQKRLIQKLEDAAKEEDVNNQTLIDECEFRIRQLNNKLSKETDLLTSLSYTELEQIQKRRTELQTISVQIGSKKKHHETNLKFFKDNDNCPTCLQLLDPVLKTSKINESETAIGNFDKGLEDLQLVLQETISKEKKLLDSKEQIRQLESNIRIINNDIMRESKQLDTLKMPVVRSQAVDTTNEYNILSDLEKQLETTTDNLRVVLDEREVLDMTKNLLKDDAVKARIVREYLNFINKKINEYLNAMDFYIGMRLDENFNESFTAMHKENFSYGSLSSGQKCRVNLALWLSLLEVASVKNSINCNFLALDEILENLDYEGVQSFMKLTNELLDDKNVFIVTQRFDEFQEYFRSSLRFKLNQGFTEIEQ